MCLLFGAAGLKSLRKKIDADVLDEAWTKRRLAGGGADTDKFYPAGGLYWMITNDDEYGAQQGPVDREGMATLMEMEVRDVNNVLLATNEQTKQLCGTKTMCGVSSLGVLE